MANRPLPTTHGEALILRALDEHANDSANPHDVGLAQLADLTNAVAGTAGQVPTKQSDGTYLLETPPGAAGGAAVGTAIPKPHDGAGSAGVASTSSREDHVHPTAAYTAADYGAVAWSMDPANVSSTLTTVAGTVHFAKVKQAVTGPVSTVQVPISTGGAGVTNSWVGVYAADGTLLGSSADQGTSWTATGTKTVALSTPTASIPVGTTLFLAILSIGGAPVIRSAVAASTVNSNLTAAGGYRFGKLAAQSALPSPLVLSTTSSDTSPLLLLAL